MRSLRADGLERVRLAAVSSRLRGVRQRVQAVGSARECARASWSIVATNIFIGAKRSLLWEFIGAKRALLREFIGAKRALLCYQLEKATFVSGTQGGVSSELGLS